MSDEEVFKEQLRQEQIAKENDDVNSDRTRVDPDGTVYEYDIAKKAWFPKIDADFIARYQMNYGTDVGSADATTESTAETAGTPVTTMDPSSSAYYYNYYAKSGSADTATTDSRSYQEWYDYYYGKYASETTEAKGDASDTTSETSIPPPPSDINSQEYYDWYYMYYGATKSNSNKDSTSTIQHDDEQSSEHHDSGKSESPPGKNQKGDSKQQIADILAAKRKAAEPPSWFEVTQDKNTNVYVSGLPLDMTDDDFKELMNKCGLIMFDPLTKKAKLKLYKDENGQNKGDGRCCYIKPESVELALQILDGSEIKGHKIYVERARFELKGAFDPSKRRRKLTKQEKKKFKLKQEKLFDWRPDKPLGTRNRWERIVILKNVFDPKIIEKDPVQINEIRKDMEEECARYGDVRRVQVYDRHPEGVVAITFKEPEEADVCIEALNGRWFAKKRLTAMAHDGKKKYHVDETEEEYMKRLKQWEDFLEEAAGDKKDKKTGNGMEHSGDVQSKGKQSEGKQSNDEAQSEPVQSDAKQLAEKCSENSGNLQAGENVSENVQSMGEQSSDVHIEKKWSKDSESKSKQSEDSGNGQPMENISENLQSTDEQSDGKQSEKTILNVNQEEKEDSAMNMTVN